MSQIEQRLESVLRREPEIEKCYRKGLVNRRALARYLLERGVGTNAQFDAVVAAIRRHDFGHDDREARSLFDRVRVSLKDRITILDFEKQRELIRRLERVISHIDYDRGDTLKIVVGTSSLKLLIDEAREPELRPVLAHFQVRNRVDQVSEISMLFPEEASLTRGVLSAITRELSLNDIVISELLTSSPELLVYVRDQYVSRAYEVIRRIQQERDDGSSPSSAPRRRRPS